MKVRKFALVILFLISLNILFIAKNSITVSAISENIIIFQLQTGGSGGVSPSSQEIVLLYNNSTQDIDITGWCVQYFSASDNPGFSACASPPDSKTQIWLSVGGIASFATSQFVSANSGFVADFMMSGGLLSTAGHLKLLNNAGELIDKIGWGTATNPETQAVPAHTSGSVLSRNLSSLAPDTDNNSVDFSSKSLINPIISGVYEIEIVIDLCPNLENLQEILPTGYMQDSTGDCYLDICPNLDELQRSLPTDFFLNSDGECNLKPLENKTIFITEIYPDAPSYDNGLEFIELYNPNSETINLAGYKLQVGPSFNKEFIFANYQLQPKSYKVFSDTETGIVLPNTSGVALRLVAPAGNTVYATAVYMNAKDSLSWALVEDIWIFTNQITPNSANKPFLETLESEIVDVTSVLGPCPAGKYRNPLTNRCRNIETAVSALKPCDEDEFRNPETNRCRKASTASTNLQPCDAGEERNPETNRCRKVAVLGVTTEADLSNIEDLENQTAKASINWPILGLAVGMCAVYVVYEWRHEIRQKIYLFKKG